MWASDEWPVGSVCSAAGGMDLGFERAGMRTRWVCEVDPFRRKLLAKHFPAATQYPDLTTLDPSALEAVRVLIGGTPCQDLSNAGLRAGLDGSRSRLFFDYMRIRNALNIEWAVWENVYGSLSSSNGLDFARVLGAFVGAAVDVPSGGWPSAGVATGPWGGCVWRVLNAQYFGVPQRRRRVFVVGHLGGECPPEVLFEPAGSDGDPQASDATEEEVAATFGVRTSGTLGAHSTGGSDPTDLERMGAYVRVSHALTTSAQRYGDGSEETFVVRGEPARGRVRSLGDAGASEGRREAGTGLCGGADRFDGAAPDAHRTRTPDGVAGRLDGPIGVRHDGVSHALTSAGHDASEDGTGRGAPLVVVTAATLTKGTAKSPGVNPPGRRQEDDTNLALDGQGFPRSSCAYDPLPDGRRDSATGDGVVAQVAEWVARRLIAHAP